jgi:dTDP-glucose 4,6-dehydratase
MNYLVTGGAGFIGSHFCQELLPNLNSDDQLVILDKLGIGSDLENLQGVIGEPGVTFIKGDITIQKDIDLVIEDINIIINFAAESHVDRSITDPGSFVINNVLGTQILLESAKKSNVTMFVQISTDEVYGPIDSGEADEKYILRPSSPYAASKAAADLVALSYFTTFGMDVRVTRCANNFGRNQNEEKLIPLLVKNITENKNLPIYGNGLNVREWIHVTDHCRAILLVIRSGKAGEIYNIGSSDRLTNLEVTELLLTHKPESKSKIEYVKDRLGHDTRYAINSTKIRTELGFVSEKSLLKSVEELFWKQETSS